MAFQVDVKLIVSTDHAGTYGMKKTNGENYGTLIPNRIGNNYAICTQLTADTTYIRLTTNEKIEGLNSITVTTAAGTTFDNMEWDGTDTYVLANSSIIDTFKDHYDGVLELRIADETAPTGFANPTITNETSTGFKINWLAPTGGDSVDNYIVDVVDTNDDPIAGSPFTMAGTTLSKTVSGLLASTTYFAAVTAKNGGGEIQTDFVNADTTA